MVYLNKSKVYLDFRRQLIILNPTIQLINPYTSSISVLRLIPHSYTRTNCHFCPLSLVSMQNGTSLCHQYCHRSNSVVLDCRILRSRDERYPPTIRFQTESMGVALKSMFITAVLYNIPAGVVIIHDRARQITSVHPIHVNWNVDYCPQIWVVLCTAVNTLILGAKCYRVLAYGRNTPYPVRGFYVEAVCRRDPNQDCKIYINNIYLIIHLSIQVHRCKSNIHLIYSYTKLYKVINMAADGMKCKQWVQINNQYIYQNRFQYNHLSIQNT